MLQTRSGCKFWVAYNYKRDKKDKRDMKDKNGDQTAVYCYNGYSSYDEFVKETKYHELSGEHRQFCELLHGPVIECYDIDNLHCDNCECYYSNKKYWSV